MTNMKHVTKYMQTVKEKLESSTIFDQTNMMMIKQNVRNNIYFHAYPVCNRSNIFRYYKLHQQPCTLIWYS